MGSKWNGGHIHSAHAIDDVAATCTTAGYTGRTFCDVCNSVVDWGTTEAATGHTYTMVDGVRKCACGELFTGEFEGVSYVNGIPEDGWVGNRYFTNGVMYTGVKEVEGCYYDFGTTGVCEGKVKYTGLFDIDGVNYYAKFGVLSSGWYQIDGEWYYFMPETGVAADGNVTTTDGITFEFVNGLVQHPVWEVYGQWMRCWFGPDFYHNTSKNIVYMMAEVDGENYFFNSAGCMQTGMIVTHESNNFTTMYCYDCGSDGKAVPYNGVYKDIFYLNGVQQHAYQLVQYDGNYYFVSDGNKIAKNTSIYLGGSAEKAGFAKGYYDFDAEGKMVIRNGVVGDYLYINNVKQNAYQLVQYKPLQ